MKSLYKNKIIFLLSILSIIFIVAGCSKNDTMTIDNKEVNVAKSIPVLMYHHFDDTSDTGAVVVKDEFKKLYKGNERILFSILKQLYYLDKSELMYGYNLFSQLTNSINKRQLDQKIFIELHQEIPYSKRNQIHYINNQYKNEISRLEIKRSYIKLELEQENSTFFKMLEQ